MQVFFCDCDETHVVMTDSIRFEDGFLFFVDVETGAGYMVNVNAVSSIEAF